MKKIIPIILASGMLAGMLAGCGEKPADAGTDKNTAGYSVYTYISSSKAATAEANGVAEVNSYIAYTAVDANGKIFKAGIDAAQSKINFDAQGQLAADTDLTAKPLTKNERGEDYGMRKASKIGKEWFEQAQALSDWSIGKTLADVSATKVNDDGKFEDADLVSSVTVTAASMKTPLSNSAEHQLVGTVPADAKLGLGVSTSIKSSKSATAEAAGVGQVDSSIAIVALDSAGKIAAVAFDNIQSKVQFNADGTFKSDLTALTKTKVELKEEYGMAKSSKIGKEWYQQAEAFAEWCVGKTVAEVTGMQTKKVDDNHPQVPDVADLNSSVTINVGDLLTALEKAAANAK